MAKIVYNRLKDEHNEVFLAIRGLNDWLNASCDLLYNSDYTPAQLLFKLLGHELKEVLKDKYGNELDEVYGPGFLDMIDAAVEDMIIYNRDLHLIDFLIRCFPSEESTRSKGPTRGLVFNDAVAYRSQEQSYFFGTYAVVDGQVAFVGKEINDDMTDEQLLNDDNCVACIFEKNAGQFETKYKPCSFDAGRGFYVDGNFIDPCSFGIAPICYWGRDFYKLDCIRKLEFDKIPDRSLFLCWNELLPEYIRKRLEDYNRQREEMILLQEQPGDHNEEENAKEEEENSKSDKSDDASATGNANEEEQLPEQLGKQLGAGH